MANEVSIKVSTDSRKAAQDFDHLRSSIKLLDAEARRLGTGFTAGASQAETALGRLQTRMARLRTEIHQTQAASRNLGGGGGRAGAGVANFVGGTSLGQYASAAGIGAAVSSFASTAYQDYRSQAQAESFLASAVKQTAQSYAAQASEVAKLRKELGLTQAQALQLQAQSLRFTGTIGRPQDAGRLSRALANALAASGRSPDEIPNRLQQLSTGQDELFDVLGPVKIGKSFASSPEGIYRAYAKEILNVKRELTDLEKTQARYFAVLQAGESNMGAVEKRLSTTAGQVELLTGRVRDLGAAWVKAWAESRGGKQAVKGANAAIGALGGGAETDYGTAAVNFLSYTNPITALGIAAGNWSDINAGPKGDPRALLANLTSLGRSTLGAFGVSFGGGSSVGAPYSGSLDNRTILGRDPFADNATDRLRLASERAVNRSEYFNLRDRTQGGALGLVGSAAGDFGNIVGYGDRLAAFKQSETPQERASRVFSISSRFGAGAYAALSASGAFTDADARARSEAEQRRFLISGLGAVDPSELTADQQRAYEDALVKAQEDSLKNAIETLSNVIKMQKDLKRLADKLAGDDKEPEPVILQIDNRSDTKARFANPLMSSGDSLRSDDR